MRHTSQAVLLLIGAASAGAISTDYNQNQQVQGAAPTGADQGKIVISGAQGTNTYTYKVLNPIYLSGLNDKSDVAVGAVAAQNDTNTSAATEKSCVTCVRGYTQSATTTGKQSVWCSGAWNYEYTNAAATYPDNSVTVGGGDGVVAPEFDATGGGNDGAAANKNKGDQGFCCYAYETNIGPNITTNGKGQTSPAGQQNDWSLNNVTCPAKFSNTPGSSGGTTGNLQIQTTSWWCSDGSFVYKNGNTSDTFGNAAAEMTDTLIDQSNSPDRRLELMLAACRQKRVICGPSVVDVTQAVEVPDTTTAPTAASKATRWTKGMKTGEKCTWSVMTTTKAPTFAVGHTTKAKGLPDKYDLVYQEFIDGWQLASAADNGYMIIPQDKSDGNSASGVGGGIVNPGVSGANYLAAYKHNYFDEDSYARPHWGEAYTLQSNNYDRGVTCEIASDFSTATNSQCTSNGSAGATNWEVWFSRKWFDLEPSGVQYQQELVKTFNTAAATSNADATKYNAYLDKLAENAEVDAFAAFFSPPEKPAFVKRPNQPTAPGTYTGLQHWSVAKQGKFLDAVGGAASSPAANEYILGNNLRGGWGAWTIGRIKGGNTEPTAAWNNQSTDWLWHSFGRLGTYQSPLATPMNTLSWVKNWGREAGINNNGTGERTGVANQAPKDWRKTFTGGASGTSTPVALSATVMCGAEASTRTNNCLWAGTNATTLGKGAANTQKIYLNVSVWATAQAAADWTDYDFYINFYQSAWADGSDYYPATSTTTLTTLKSPAAAQALAASAAAIVAVAAALY